MESGQREHCGPPEVSKPSHHFMATWSWLGHSKWRPRPSEGTTESHDEQRWIVGVPYQPQGHITKGIELIILYLEDSAICCIGDDWMVSIEIVSVPTHKLNISTMRAR